MTSFFGQGGCQAIEDAAVLGNLLQERVLKPGIGFANLTHQETSKMLLAYSQRREKRVQDLTKFSSNFALLHTANLPYGTGGFIRGLIYGYAPSWVWMWFLQWLYGVQPTVAGLESARLKSPDHPNGS